MKKLTFACCAAVMALMLAACAEEKPRCYKITTAYTIDGELFSETGYMWETKTIMDAYKKNQIEVAKSKGGMNIVVEYEPTSSTTQEDCLHLR